jgi:hypothetical protein
MARTLRSIDGLITGAIMKTLERFIGRKPLGMASSLVAAGLFTIILSACSRDRTNAAADSVAASSTAPTNAVAASAPIPAAINDVGTYGEDLYDQAKAGNWVAAKAYLDSLHAAATNLPRTDQIQSERSQLDGAIAALDQAVAARNRTGALEAANRVTFLSAQMTTPYHGATPTEVLLLDYYGRELDIWSAQRNTSKLKETAAALTSTWNALRPTVEKNGGGVAAGHTDALVARINAAKSASEYARVATPFLDEVDELEKVFTKQ